MTTRGASHHLFDHYVISQIVEEAPNKRTPSTKFTFSSEQAKPYPPTLPQFCFPDAEYLDPWDSTFDIERAETFTFVLTDEAGKHMFGFCKRLLLPLPARTTSKRFPATLCLMTHYQLLDILSVLNESGAQDFLSTLLLHPLPPPGEVFHGIRIPSAALVKYHQLSSGLVRPEDTGDRPLGDFSCEALIDSLDSIKLLFLFTAMLCERRIIIFSNDLGRVTKCAIAAVSLLYPFNWPHIFIPILPRTLINYTCAPMPFIAGVHSPTVPLVKKLPLEQVIYVDLDNNSASANIEDVSMLPKEHINTLKAVIDKVIRQRAETGIYDNKLLTTGFLDYFISIFGKYRKFMKLDPAAGGKIRFDRAAFLKSRSKQIQKFIQMFCSMQMFERFIAEREALAERGYPASNSEFEHRVTEEEKLSASQGGFMNKLQQKVNSVKTASKKSLTSAAASFFGKPSVTTAAPSPSRPSFRSDSDLRYTYGDTAANGTDDWSEGYGSAGGPPEVDLLNLPSAEFDFSVPFATLHEQFNPERLIQWYTEHYDEVFNAPQLPANTAAVPARVSVKSAGAMPAKRPLQARGTMSLIDDEIGPTVTSGSTLLVPTVAGPTPTNRDTPPAPPPRSDVVPRTAPSAGTVPTNQPLPPKSPPANPITPPPPLQLSAVPAPVATTSPAAAMTPSVPTPPTTGRGRRPSRPIAVPPTPAPFTEKPVVPPPPLNWTLPPPPPTPAVAASAPVPTGALSTTATSAPPPPPGNWSLPRPPSTSSNLMDLDLNFQPRAVSTSTKIPTAPPPIAFAPFTNAQTMPVSPSSANIPFPAFGGMPGPQLSAPLAPQAATPLFGAPPNPPIRTQPMSKPPANGGLDPLDPFG